MLDIRAEDFNKDPIQLPNGYRWIIVENYNTLSAFLKTSYISNEQMSLYYTSDMLQWMLTPPNYIHDWHIGIESKGQIVGFISAIPKELNIGSS